jgi:hypothetical protein
LLWSGFWKLFKARYFSRHMQDSSFQELFPFFSHTVLISNQLIINQFMIDTFIINNEEEVVNPFSNF